ncbi:MAG: hypothetical protein HY539_02395 [Deltaproteobacteria bacterium]|nr:hypothetical protein [Deltaproteobacteria bacterium]MBI4196650.1 hypothetical protein [Deltaproteobacteria bacterium]
MSKTITIALAAIFAMLLASDLVLAGTYGEKCAACHKAKGVTDDVIKAVGYDACVKIATEGKKGEKGMMPPLKAMAEPACKDLFGK